MPRADWSLVKLDSYVKFDGRDWRVAEFLEEPNTGLARLVELIGVDEVVSRSVVVPVGLLAELVDARDDARMLRAKLAAHEEQLDAVWNEVNSWNELFDTEDEGAKVAQRIFELMTNPPDTVERLTSALNAHATALASIEQAARTRGWNEEVNTPPWSWLVDRLVDAEEDAKKLANELIEQINNETVAESDDASNGADRG